MRNLMNYLNAALAFLLLTISHQTFSDDTAKRCIQLFNDSEFIAAIAVCQQAAEQGDAASQTVLGEMYDAGDGVETDQRKVVKWWTMASGNSYLPAQNLLALKYYYGGDVFEPQTQWNQDYKKAFEIWKQSASRGVATSQYMLGEMYLHGQGVKKDYSESYAWFKIALEGGYKLATDSLIELSRLITSHQKQTGLARIQSLKKKIAE